MKTTVLISLVFGAALASGCRVQHLGPHTGTAYKQAFADQADSESAAGPTAMSATDAKAVMRAHHGDSTESASAGGGVPAMSFGGAAVPQAAGGAWPGATGNISLEAK